MGIYYRYANLGPVLKQRRRGQTIRSIPLTVGQGDVEDDIMKSYKLLASAVIEIGIDDYKRVSKSKAWELKKELTKDNIRKMSDIERNYADSVRFFTGPWYELYASLLNFELGGRDVMKILDSQQA